MAYPTKKLGNDQDILAQLERFVDRVGCPARPAEEPRLRGDRRKAERASWSIRLDGKMTLRQFGKLQKRPIRFSERTRRLPNEAPRTRWEMIMSRIEEAPQQDFQPLPVKRRVNGFRPINSYRERRPSTRRSHCRSAAKAGDDGGGDDDGAGDPPGPVLAVPSPHNFHVAIQLNSLPRSRTVHPCSWCMDWRWAV